MSWMRGTKLSISALSSVSGTALAMSFRRWARRVLAAGAVAVVEGFEGGGFGLLDGLEAGPLEEEVGGQGAPELVAT